MHNATSQSLVLMDEIGRGTSTFDGLSLAFSCAQYLAQEVKAFTLFATHYFELTTLADDISAIKNVHLDAVQHAEKIIFLHAVKAGPANQSYGIQVAQLAGVPRTVIQRAKAKLQELETHVHEQITNTIQDKQRDLFAGAEKTHPVISLLQDVNPDQLTPKEALDLVYELKNSYDTSFTN